MGMEMHYFDFQFQIEIKKKVLTILLENPAIIADFGIVACMKYIYLCIGKTIYYQTI